MRDKFLSTIARRALIRGAEARKAGKPNTTNPYKVSERGNGKWWEMGWNIEMYRENLVEDKKAFAAATLERQIYLSNT